MSLPSGPGETVFDGPFSGTSAATPIAAGAFGLLFQMWHEQVFNGYGGGSTVFVDRPHFTTAKAMMINTAFRYDWNLTGATPPNTELTRARQGWGMPNLHDAAGMGLYDVADSMLIINETDDLTYIGQQKTYVVESDGTMPLRITMVYADPGGVTSASKHQVNDLSLKVEKDGVVWWGNYGLGSGNSSIAGGGEDSLNTVENVFIQSPSAGAYSIKVILTKLNEDGNPETPTSIDADFALVVSGIMTTGASSADIDKNGIVDARDFVLFMESFLLNNVDLDHDGFTTSLDMTKFINDFFACPESVVKGGR